MPGRFSVEAVFKAVDKVTAPVSRMQNRVGKFTRSAKRGFKSLSRSVDKFNTKIKDSGEQIAAAAAIAGVALATALAPGVAFEQTLVSAAVKFPGEVRKGTTAFVELEQAARKVGRTTEFTSAEAASGLKFLALAGFDAKQAIGALPGVIDLATAAEIDLAQATDVATDSLGAFGLMVKDPIQLTANLARMNDVLAKTTTSANTNMEQLFESISEGAPVFTSAGQTLETYAALTGKLADAGIKGSRAGTTLKNVIVRLAKPTGEAAALLRKLGIQTQDANGDFLDVVDILGQFEKALDGMGSAKRSAILSEIFGRIPLAGVNVLLKTGAENINELRDSLLGAAGASKTMASVMRDTTQGSLNGLKSAVEAVGVSFFKMNEGGIKETIDKTTEWVRANEAVIATKLGEWLKFITDNFETIISVITRVAGLVAGLMVLNLALKTIALTMTVVNLIMTANPIGLIITAIGILIGLAAALWVAWEPIKEFFANLWDDIVAGFMNMVQPIIDKVKGIGGFFGFGGDNTEAQSATPQVVNPQERVARSIQENRSMSEVTIRDETGRAEMTRQSGGPNGLKLVPTGAF